MSGATPRHAFTCPHPPAEDCRVPVDLFVTEALRGQIDVSHSEAMRWVDAEFDAKAQAAYVGIGEPSLQEPKYGWKVFSQMEAWLLKE